MKRFQIFHSRKERVFLAVLIMLIGGFTLLSIFVISTPASHIDLHISEEIQERNNDTLSLIMQYVSWFGNFPVSGIMIVVTALLFLIFKHKREAVFVLLTSISGVISSLLKMLINRPRPTADVVKIIEIAKQQSFPSGHTLFYTVFFGMLVIIMANLRSVPQFYRYSIIVISTLLIFAVPFSRIYLGAHWFTDVVGGFLLGMTYLAILGYFYLFSNKTSTPTQK